MLTNNKNLKNSGTLSNSNNNKGFISSTDNNLKRNPKRLLNIQVDIGKNKTPLKKENTKKVEITEPVLAKKTQIFTNEPNSTSTSTLNLDRNVTPEVLSHPQNTQVPPEQVFHDKSTDNAFEIPTEEIHFNHITLDDLEFDEDSEPSEQMIDDMITKKIMVESQDDDFLIDDDSSSTEQNYINTDNFLKNEKLDDYLFHTESVTSTKDEYNKSLETAFQENRESVFNNYKSDDNLSIDGTPEKIYINNDIQGFYPVEIDPVVFEDEHVLPGEFDFDSIDLYNEIIQAQKNGAPSKIIETVGYDDYDSIYDDEDVYSNNNFFETLDIENGNSIEMDSSKYVTPENINLGVNSSKSKFIQKAENENFIDSKISKTSHSDVNFIDPKPIENNSDQFTFNSMDISENLYNEIVQAQKNGNFPNEIPVNLKEEIRIIKSETLDQKIKIEEHDKKINFFHSNQNDQEEKINILQNDVVNHEEKIRQNKVTLDDHEERIVKNKKNVCAVKRNVNSFQSELAIEKAYLKNSKSNSGTFVFLMIALLFLVFGFVLPILAPNTIPYFQNEFSVVYKFFSSIYSFIFKL